MFLEPGRLLSPPPHSASGGNALRLLDGFLLLRNGERLSVPTGGQRLVALLGLGGAHDRAVTAGTLWPDVTDDHARGCLRTALWRLQRVWPDLISAAEHRIALNPVVDVDTTRFVARAVETIKGTARAATDEIEPCLADLTAGELLPGWYDDWVVFERERLRQLRMHALERLSQQLVARDECALALEAALEAVRMEPLRESAHSAVIAVHLAEGNLVEAQRHYETMRRLLRSELGVEPFLVRRPLA